MTPRSGRRFQTPWGGVEQREREYLYAHDVPPGYVELLRLLRERTNGGRGDCADKVATLAAAMHRSSTWLKVGYVVLQRVGAIQRRAELQRGGTPGAAWAWLTTPVAFEEWPAAAEQFAARNGHRASAQRGRPATDSHDEPVRLPRAGEKTADAPLSSLERTETEAEKGRNPRGERTESTVAIPERFEEGVRREVNVPSRSNSKAGDRASGAETRGGSEGALPEVSSTANASPSPRDAANDKAASEIVETAAEPWRGALMRIRQQVGCNNFVAWFRGTSLRDGRTVVSPNAFGRKWVEERYRTQIATALGIPSVEIVLDGAATGPLHGQATDARDRFAEQAL